MVKRPTTFSMRMPEDLNEKIQEYATAHNCTKAEAMSHFARAGIDLEENGPKPAQEESATAGPSSDETLAKIHERLDALQNLPAIESEPEAPTAIIPVDIRDKIQSYSSEHNCTEHDALAYYARIGIQADTLSHLASKEDVAELARRLDVLATRDLSRGEQLEHMNELLSNIRDYTKPNELELDGEVADEAEDVEEPELTDEERQAIADEHTRRIVSDVMGEYAARAIEAEGKRTQTGTLNPWIPVLVAVIVSLVIGIMILIIR